MARPRLNLLWTATALLVVGVACADLRSSPEDAAYEGTASAELSVLQPEQPSHGDQFGYAVGFTDDVAIVGMPGATAAGGAESFEQAGNATWVELASEPALLSRFSAPAPQDFAQFGFSVALSRDSAVVGEPFSEGSAGRVYAVRRPFLPTFTPKLLEEPSAGADRSFGWSVAASDDRLLSGVGYVNGPGSAYVYRFESDAWVRDGTLRPPTTLASDGFGVALALDGTIAIVGAPLDDERGEQAGAAYAFIRTESNGWVRDPKILGSTTIAGDLFGSAVALVGDTAVIGAVGSGDLGSAYVFQRQSNGQWLERTELQGDLGEDAFGQAVAIAQLPPSNGEPSASQVVWVGAPNRHDAIGAVYSYVGAGSTWSPRDVLVLNDDMALTGVSLSAFGASVLVGASYADELSGRAFFVGAVDGDACSVALDCASRHCVEGVCCDSECGSRCRSCLAVHKTSGPDGQCGNVKAFDNPRPSECPAQDPESCGLTGSCDGDGACALYQRGTECSRPSCDGQSAEPADTCDGSGHCSSAAAVSCSPYACRDGACVKRCEESVDCAPGQHCSGAGECEANRGLGATCEEGHECESQFCADGVCCEFACTGQCEACAEPKHAGVCVPVVGQPRANHPACSAGAQVCETQSCDGKERLRCAGHVGAETTCQAADCRAGVAVPELRCDGRGACPEREPQDCGAYACRGQSCVAVCDSKADCAAGHYCDPPYCLKGPRCSSDNSIAFDEDGRARTCSPFTCEAGKCVLECQHTGQCDVEHYCHPKTHQCEPMSSELQSRARQSSNSCRISGHESGPRSSLWILGAAALLGRRRQSDARTSPTSKRNRLAHEN